MKSFDFKFACHNLNIHSTLWEKYFLLIFFSLFTLTPCLYADCQITQTSIPSTVTASILAQSFPACDDGILETIQVYAESPADNLTLLIYEGEGSSGNQLGELENVSLGTGWNEMDISELTVSVTNSQMYTFLLMTFENNLFLRFADHIYTDGRLYFSYTPDPATLQASESPDLSFQIDIIDGNSGLYVQVFAFTASYQNNAVILAWQTETETNNAGFMIDRSTDGKNWQRIASFQTHTELQPKGMFSAYNDYTFSDQTAEPGKTYNYRLSDTSTTGIVTVHAVVIINTPKLMEKRVQLQVYPNPFNPQTTIYYTIKDHSSVKVEIYDLLGQHVSTLYDGYQESGSYQFYWNGRFENGLQAPSGNYFVRLQTSNQYFIQKILIMR